MVDEDTCDDEGEKKYLEVTFEYKRLHCLPPKVWEEVIFFTNTKTTSKGGFCIEFTIGLQL